MDRQLLADAERLCRDNIFVKEMGICLREVDRDAAVLSLRVEERHRNPLGFAHGGALYTMADCAGGIAARTDGGRYVTLSGSMHYFRSGAVGDVVEARARVRRRGRTTCYAEVDLVNGEGTLLSTASFTYFRVRETP